MSRRRLKRGETRPRYAGRYDERDAATYRPHGTPAEVRRRIEAESGYQTTADALADMRRAGDAASHVLCDLLGRVMAMEAENAKLRRRLDLLVIADNDEDESTERRLRRLETDREAFGNDFARLDAEVEALQAVVLANSHPPRAFADKPKTSTPGWAEGIQEARHERMKANAELSIGGRREK